MKKKYWWIISIVFIVIILYLMIVIFAPESWRNPFSSKYSQSIQNEWKNCIEDKDCSLVYPSCCYDFGSLSLNNEGKEAIENWKTWNCINAHCPLLSMHLPLVDPEAICSNNICSIKYNVNSIFCNRYCLLFECNRNEISEDDKNKTVQEIQNELEKVNISFEEAKNQCNCPEYCLWNVKVETCASLQNSPNLCKPSTNSILVKGFDANKDGNIDNKDTLFELCKNYFNKTTDLECKDFCDC